MAIGEDIVKVIESAVPGLSLTEIAIRLVGVLIFAGIAVFVIWKLFFADGQAQQKHDLGAAQAQGLVGAAQSAAGQHAVGVVSDNAAKEVTIHERTNTNYVEITKQPGAGDTISDEVDAAFRHAVCMRASASGLPDCQRLREADPQ